MSKPVWAYPTCGEDFTRKSSAVRHSSKLHKGRSLPVRYIDYLTGRLSGQYQPPLTPPRLLGRKNKTVADSSTGDILCANDFKTKNRSEYIAAPPTATNPLRNPVAEAVRNFANVEKTYTQLLPLINVNTFPTDIGIAKPIGFSGICDLCLSGRIEAVWNFVEDGSLTKVIHACDDEVVMRVKRLAGDKRKAFHYASFRCLADAVNYWIGHGEVYLKAEELLPTERYDFVTDSERQSTRGDYIGLGALTENHWADRAIKENKKIPTATGAVNINKDELLDFLSIAGATFGVFRVKIPDGGTRDFFMYVVRGLEFCKFNHLKELAAKSSNINNNNNTSQQTDLYNVIQFVDGGSISDGID
ncbi:MAG: hypothetical protein DLM72_19945 [Candidatus Nitrosopolaris wilkensis]|nr:MAG: hypothetical protein DLM72_19945 [Candidatus Nitrosopolaris wilkensis]